MKNFNRKLLLGSVAIALASSMAVAGEDIEELAGSVDDLDERIEAIETQVLMNKINFGLGFRQRMDNYKKTFADGESFTDNNLWSTKFSLNLKSKIDDNMKFNGRISMYKYWADQGANAQGQMDPKQGRVPNNSGLYVERAYVDWALAKGSLPIVLTMGRQPSSDGPSHQFKDNTVRKATYSALAFDGATDGLVLTTVLQNITGNKGNAVRLVYGKGYQEHQTSRTDSNPYTGVKETVPDNVMTGFFIDASVPGVSNSLIQYGMVTAKDVPEMVSSNGYSKTLGDIDISVALLEFTNMAGSGLDFFIQQSTSTAKPNGNSVSYTMTSTKGQADMPTNMGLMTNGNSADVGTESKTGTAMWAGFRYTPSFANRFKIGYEYNKGDKNWLNFTWGANDPMNKLAARGKATEFYLVSQINRYAFLRFGQTKIDYDYTGSGNYHGTPLEIDGATMKQYVAGGYSNPVDKVENTYFLFNLLF